MRFFFFKEKSFVCHLDFCSKAAQLHWFVWPFFFFRWNSSGDRLESREERRLGATTLPSITSRRSRCGAVCGSEYLGWKIHGFGLEQNPTNSIMLMLFMLFMLFMFHLKNTDMYFPHREITWYVWLRLKRCFFVFFRGKKTWFHDLSTFSRSWLGTVLCRSHAEGRQGENWVTIF